MWKWLKVSSNQKLLALLGGGFAAIVVAIWTVYTHFYPASKSDGSASNTRVVEARCGIAAGNDVLSGDVSISCGLDEDEIGLLIGEKLDNFDLQEIINNIDSSNPDVNSELSEISRSLGITEESLRSIFVKLSSSSYERESIRSSLIELIRMNTRIVLDNHADRMPPESMDGIPTKNSGNVAAIRGANIQIVGSYSVSGNNPGSTRIYRGRVNVTKKGDVFDVFWDFPDVDHRGEGIYLNGIFSVAYETLSTPRSGGLAVYAVKQDGSLEGEWAPSGADEIGREVWRR